MVKPRVEMSDLATGGVVYINECAALFIENSWLTHTFNEVRFAVICKDASRLFDHPVSPSARLPLLAQEGSSI
jgi:hypothetical protein